MISANLSFWWEVYRVGGCLSEPKYRYPYYDENGKGKLLYGYGGPELYQYKSFSPLDGIH
uniref:Uncharacterized protein n=1 Tax=Anopheles merus TaxID=30066 RepID=A0A182UY75_ANOME